MKTDTEVAPVQAPTRRVAPDRVAQGAIVCVALAASVGILPWLGSSMFADEGATLYSAHLSWSNLWAQSQYVDLVLLPYYVLVHFWLMVSDDIAWVRALSLLAFFGSIVAIGWTGLRLAGRWCGIIAAVLTATSTIVVEKSLNARPYELSTFFVVLSAVALFRWLQDPRSRWSWAFSVLALLATAMQLFSVLAPISMLAGVLAVRPALAVQRLRALLFPLTLLAVVAVAWVIASIGEVGQVNWIANQSITTRLLDEARGPILGQLYELVLFVILVIVATKLALVWSGGGRDLVVQQVGRDRDVLGLTIGWTLIPTVALSILSFVHPIFSSRYVASSAPGAALLVAFVCVRAFPRVLGPSRDVLSRAQTRTMAVASIAAVVLLVFGYVSTASAQQEDLQGPAQYVAQHARAGDAIALPDHAITSAVGYYLTGDKAHVALWTQSGVGQRYVEGFDLALHPSGDLPRRVWLVTDGSVADVTRFQKALLQQGYLLVGYKLYNGSTLLLYQSTQPVTAVGVPSNGSTVRGVIPLVAGAGVNLTTVTKVRFVLSGNGYAMREIGQAYFTKVGALTFWNSATVPNGTYSLQSVATTATGSSGYSHAITITVDN